MSNSYLCSLKNQAMRVGDKHYHTVWMEGSRVYMIDQNLLPFRFIIYTAATFGDTVQAIRDMKVRGAGAIGAAGGFAMAQAFLDLHTVTDPEKLAGAREVIRDARPTAADLSAATSRVYKKGIQGGKVISPAAAVAEAQAIALENIEEARKIGEYGSSLFGPETRMLTHCNAGWLGFVDYGSALSPVYHAKSQGKKVFVYVDETRPRNQGARLTAWELTNEGIPHAIIADNASAMMMASGKVDLVITGADRIAANGDAANKIGTLEKAIAARYYNIPFYVAAPRSTFDPLCEDGSRIHIEYRDEDEVKYMTGPDSGGEIRSIRVANPGSDAINPAFDVTPASLITGIITSGGIIKPAANDIKKFLNKLKPICQNRDAPGPRLTRT